MVHKGSQKGSQKGSLLQHGSPKLTVAEKDVLHLLTKEFLTVSQIAVKRSTTTRAVYKIRKGLIEKGILSIVNQAIFPQEMKVHKKGGHSSEPVNHFIRLHGEQYHIKIISCDDRYRQLISQGNKRIELDGQVVFCYRNSVEIYSNLSFFGKTPGECDSKSLSYWTHFFVRLEQSIKCILMKRDHMNISRVKAEYAETDNELAKTAIKEHDKVRVVGSDGKVWLLIDNSFGFKECETVHPKESKQDMQDVVQPFFNDLRENEYVPLSEISKNLAIMSKQITELSHAVRANASTINTILEVIRPQSDDPHKFNEKRPDYFG
jgi:DNA-binding CsgD family transcriptional regulator